MPDPSSHWMRLVGVYYVCASVVCAALFIHSVIALYRGIPGQPPRRPVWMRPPVMGWSEAVMGIGDILLVRTNTLAARAIQVFGRSYFNHVAIVVPSGTGPGILECDLATGTLVMTPAEWVAKYGAHFPSVLCVWRRAAPPCAAPGEVRADRVYPTLVQMILRRLLNHPPVVCADDGCRYTVHCVEAVCEMARALHLGVPSVAETRSWTPDSFTAARLRTPYLEREIELRLTASPP